MADAFVDIAEEVARLDAADLADLAALGAALGASGPPRPTTIEHARGELGACYDSAHDCRVAVTTQDWPEARHQAVQLAAHCVRLLMALPGGE